MSEMDNDLLKKAMQTNDLGTLLRFQDNSLFKIDNSESKDNEIINQDNSSKQGSLNNFNVGIEEILCDNNISDGSEKLTKLTNLPNSDEVLTKNRKIETTDEIIIESETPRALPRSSMPPIISTEHSILQIVSKNKDVISLDTHVTEQAYKSIENVSRSSSSLNYHKDKFSSREDKRDSKSSRDSKTEKDLTKRDNEHKNSSRRDASKDKKNEGKIKTEVNKSVKDNKDSTTTKNSKREERKDSKNSKDKSLKDIKNATDEKFLNKDDKLISRTEINSEKDNETVLKSDENQKDILLETKTKEDEKHKKDNSNYKSSRSDEKIEHETDKIKEDSVTEISVQKDKVKYFNTDKNVKKDEKVEPKVDEVIETSAQKEEEHISKNYEKSESKYGKEKESKSKKSTKKDSKNSSKSDKNTTKEKRVDKDKKGTKTDKSKKKDGKSVKSSTKERKDDITNDTARDLRFDKSDKSLSKEKISLPKNYSDPSSPPESYRHNRIYRSNKHRKSRHKSNDRGRPSRSRSPRISRLSDIRLDKYSNRRSERSLQMGPLNLREEFLLETECDVVNAEDQLEESFQCKMSKQATKDKRTIAEKLQLLLKRSKIIEDKDSTEPLSNLKEERKNEEISAATNELSLEIPLPKPSKNQLISAESHKSSTKTESDTNSSSEVLKKKQITDETQLIIPQPPPSSSDDTFPDLSLFIPLPKSSRKKSNIAETSKTIIRKEIPIDVPPEPPRNEFRANDPTVHSLFCDDLALFIPLPKSSKKKSTITEMAKSSKQKEETKTDNSQPKSLKVHEISSELSKSTNQKESIPDPPSEDKKPHPIIDGIPHSSTEKISKPLINQPIKSEDHKSTLADPGREVIDQIPSLPRTQVPVIDPISKPIIITDEHAPVLARHTQQPIKIQLAVNKAQKSSREKVSFSIPIPKATKKQPIIIDAHESFKQAVQPPIMPLEVFRSQLLGDDGQQPVRERVQFLYPRGHPLNTEFFGTSVSQQSTSVNISQISNQKGSLINPEKEVTATRQFPTEAENKELLANTPTESETISSNQSQIGDELRMGKNETIKVSARQLTHAERTFKSLQTETEFQKLSPTVLAPEPILRPQVQSLLSQQDPVTKVQSEPTLNEDINPKTIKEKPNSSSRKKDAFSSNKHEAGKSSYEKESMKSSRSLNIKEKSTSSNVEKTSQKKESVPISDTTYVKEKASSSSVEKPSHRKVSESSRKKESIKEKPIVREDVKSSARKDSLPRSYIIKEKPDSSEFHKSSKKTDTTIIKEKNIYREEGGLSTKKDEVSSTRTKTVKETSVSTEAVKSSARKDSLPRSYTIKEISAESNRSSKKADTEIIKEKPMERSFHQTELRSNTERESIEKSLDKNNQLVSASTESIKTKPMSSLSKTNIDAVTEKTVDAELVMLSLEVESLSNDESKTVKERLGVTEMEKSLCKNESQSIVKEGLISFDINKSPNEKELTTNRKLSSSSDDRKDTKPKEIQKTFDKKDSVEAFKTKDAKGDVRNSLRANKESTKERNVAKASDRKASGSGTEIPKEMMVDAEKLSQKKESTLSTDTGMLKEKLRSTEDERSTHKKRTASSTSSEKVKEKSSSAANEKSLPKKSSISSPVTEKDKHIKIEVSKSSQKKESHSTTHKETVKKNEDTKSSHMNEPAKSKSSSKKQPESSTHQESVVTEARNSPAEEILQTSSLSESITDEQLVFDEKSSPIVESEPISFEIQKWSPEQEPLLCQPEESIIHETTPKWSHEKVCFSIAPVKGFKKLPSSTELHKLSSLNDSLPTISFKIPLSLSVDSVISSNKDSLTHIESETDIVPIIIDKSQQLSPDEELSKPTELQLTYPDIIQFPCNIPLTIVSEDKEELTSPFPEPSVPQPMNTETDEIISTVTNSQTSIPDSKNEASIVEVSKSSQSKSTKHHRKSSQHKKSITDIQSKPHKDKPANVTPSKTNKKEPIGTETLNTFEEGTIKNITISSLETVVESDSNPSVSPNQQSQIIPEKDSFETYIEKSIINEPVIKICNIFFRIKTKPKQSPTKVEGSNNGEISNTEENGSSESLAFKWPFVTALDHAEPTDYKETLASALDNYLSQPSKVTRHFNLAFEQLKKRKAFKQQLKDKQKDLRKQRENVKEDNTESIVELKQSDNVKTSQQLTGDETKSVDVSIPQLENDDEKTEYEKLINRPGHSTDHDKSQSVTELKNDSNIRARSRSNKSRTSSKHSRKDEPDSECKRRSQASRSRRKSSDNRHKSRKSRKSRSRHRSVSDSSSDCVKSKRRSRKDKDHSDSKRRHRHSKSKEHKKSKDIKKVTESRRKRPRDKSDSTSSDSSSSDSSSSSSKSRHYYKRTKEQSSLKRRSKDRTLYKSRSKDPKKRKMSENRSNSGKKSNYTSRKRSKSKSRHRPISLSSDDSDKSDKKPKRQRRDSKSRSKRRKISRSSSKEHSNGDSTIRKVTKSRENSQERSATSKSKDRIRAQSRSKSAEKSMPRTMSRNQFQQAHQLRMTDDTSFRREADNKIRQSQLLVDSVRNTLKGSALYGPLKDNTVIGSRTMAASTVPNEKPAALTTEVEKCILTLLSQLVQGNLVNNPAIQETTPVFKPESLYNPLNNQNYYNKLSPNIKASLEAANLNFFVNSPGFTPNPTAVYPPICRPKLESKTFSPQSNFQPNFGNFYVQRPRDNIFPTQSLSSSNKNNYPQTYQQNKVPVTSFVTSVKETRPIATIPLRSQLKGFETPKKDFRKDFKKEENQPRVEHIKQIKVDVKPTLVQETDRCPSRNSSSSGISNFVMDMDIASPSLSTVDSIHGLKLNNDISDRDDLSSCSDFNFYDLEPQDPFEKYVNAPRPIYEHIVRTEVHSSALGKRFEYAYLNSTACNCKAPNPDDIRLGKAACDDICFNRQIKVECNRCCPVYDLCTNRRFQDQVYVPLEPFYSGPDKGWGVRALSHIQSGTFVIEYVGELIDFQEFLKRISQNNANNRHYLMIVQKGMYIDAGNKGNWSRFVNHSCDPNSVIEKWVVNGKTRIGFFAKRSIAKDEEITIDYQFQQYGAIEQNCYCHTSKCTGIMGKINEKLQAQIKMSEIRHREELIQRIISRDSLTEITHVSEMITVIKENCLDRDTFSNFLEVLLRTNNQLCMRTFIECGGLNVITSYLDSIFWYDWSLKLLYLQCLEHFKLKKRTLVKSGYISAMVVDHWSENPRYEIKQIVDESSVTIAIDNDNEPSFSDSLELSLTDSECQLKFTLPNTNEPVSETEKQVQCLALNIRDYFTDEKAKFFIPKIKGSLMDLSHDLSNNDSESKSVSISSSLHGGDFVQTKKNKLRKKCSGVLQRLPKEEFRRLFSERYNKSVAEKNQAYTEVFQNMKQILSSVIIEEVNNLKQNEQFSLMPLEFQNLDIDKIISGLNIVEKDGVVSLLAPQSDDACKSAANYSEDSSKQDQETSLYSTDKLPPNWRFCRCDNGRVYFYHIISKKTQWETPVYPWDAGEDDPCAYDFNESHKYHVTFDDIKLMHEHLKAAADKIKVEERFKKRMERTLQKKLSLSAGDRNKIQFSRDVFKAVKAIMKPYFSSSCTVGRVRTKVDMKYICEKFADTIIGKEVKQVVNLEDLDLSSDVLAKMRSYITKYMSRQGHTFRRSRKHRAKRESSATSTPNFSL